MGNKKACTYHGSINQVRNVQTKQQLCKFMDKAIAFILEMVEVVNVRPASIWKM